MDKEKTEDGRRVDLKYLEIYHEDIARRVRSFMLMVVFQNIFEFISIKPCSHVGPAS